MSPRLFYQQLTLLSAVVMAVILLLGYFPVFKASFNYSIVSLCFFISLSIFIFYLAKSASTSQNKNTFTQLVIGVTVLKMFLVLALIIVFYKGFHLRGNPFLIPFFFVYICFTSFEVYYMTKLGRVKTQKPAQNN
jgi:hypothetical protein